MKHRPFIIAHRGASAERTENTASAFQRALDLNADFIELDVRLSKDGIPVVFHDATLSRLTGKKSSSKIACLSHSKIKLVNISTNSCPQEKIPTLEEILNLEWKDTGLMIEIKKCPQPTDQTVKSVFDILRKIKTLPKTLLIGSFSPEIFDAAEIYKNQIDKDITIIGIVEKMEMLPSFVGRGTTQVAIWHKLISKELMTYLKNQKIEVWSFTIDDPTIAATLHAIGVKGIITNDPKTIASKLANR